MALISATCSFVISTFSFPKKQTKKQQKWISSVEDNCIIYRKQTFALSLWVPLTVWWWRSPACCLRCPSLPSHLQATVLVRPWCSSAAAWTCTEFLLAGLQQWWNQRYLYEIPQQPFQTSWNYVTTYICMLTGFLFYHIVCLGKISNLIEFSLFFVILCNVIH